MRIGIRGTKYALNHFAIISGFRGIFQVKFDGFIKSPIICNARHPWSYWNAGLTALCDPYKNEWEWRCLFNPFFFRQSLSIRKKFSQKEVM